MSFSTVKQKESVPFNYIIITLKTTLVSAGVLHPVVGSLVKRDMDLLERVHRRTTK